MSVTSIARRAGAAPTRRRAALAAAAGLLLGRRAAAQATWPSGPVRLIVPYAAGSQPDLMARLVADPLGTALGVAAVVENRPGAAGNLGSEYVVRAAPDGQTLLFGAVNNAINPTLYGNLPFDWLRELTPIAQVYLTPNVLLVGPGVPARSLEELVALARQRPGALNFGSAGAGTTMQLGGELLKQVAGIDMVHVPYRSTAAAHQDLEAGRIELIFDNLAPALARLESGRVRALAVTSAVRAERLPDVPTVAEAGYPGLAMLIWGGLFAPARTPAPVVERLHAEVLRIIDTPTFAGRLRQLGSLPVERDLAAFRAFTVAETARWGRIVAASGARVE